MRFILTESKEGIGVGIASRWVYAPLKYWKSEPLQELIRTLYLLGFELKIEKEKTRMKYCCTKFEGHVENNDFAYIKDTSYQHTFADEVGWWTIDGEMGYEMYKIKYCPFCGSKL